MKVSLISYFSFVICGSVSAQYFSAGWSPGQQEVVEAGTSGGWSTDQPIPTIVQNQPTSGSFGWAKVFTSGPVGSLFKMAGIDLTKYTENKEALLWDIRIPQVTDHNYHDMIVNEPLTEEEERDRIWFLIITVAKAPNGALSKMIDSSFDAAFNLMVANNELRHVRWGRIDYLNVTALTTKWAVWQAPRFVIVTERGRNLRFFNPNQARLDEETIINWLKGEFWKESEPWNSQYAPGGDREWVMDVLAFIAAQFYNVTSRVPNWLLVILTGSIGSFILKLSHGTTSTPPQQPSTTTQITASTPETLAGGEGTMTASSKPKKEGKRKGKK